MSTTTNLGLFKHDNPATNTEQFDVDKALNQNWDKTDKAFGEDRERLDLLEASNTIYNFKGKADTLNTIKSKTATKGDVWYCIEDSTYYAYNGTDWIPVNLNLKLEVIDELQAKTIKVLQEVETPTPVSGENIDITDSAEAKITELNISGNSKQKTRSGKNLLNLSDLSRSSNGITAVVDNGVIILNGTATDTVFIRLDKVGDSYFFDLTAGTYTLSTNNDISLSLNDYLRFVDSKGVAISETPVMLNTENASKTFTLSEDLTNIQLQIRITSGTTLTDFVIKPQLEEGSTATDYEQYGASPSSEYSSEVESCGDNVNLFDKNNANILDNIFLNTTSKMIISYIGRKCFYIKIKPNTTYAISRKKNSSVFSAGTTEDIPIANSTLIDVAWNNDGEEMTITTSSNAKYLTIYYKTETDILTDEEILDSIKIEKGSTPTPCSPYGQGCINEVVCNNNSFDGSKCDYSTETLNASYVLNNKNKITITNNGTWARIGCTISNLKRNTQYIISSDITNSSGVNCGFYTDTVRSISANTSFKSKLTLETDDNGILFVALYSNWSSTSSSATVIFDNILLTEMSDVVFIESKSQTFTIPTQQPMRSVGDIRDTFIKINNKWFERHLVKRVIFDGTESWSLGTEGFFRTIHENLPSSPVLCNQLNNAKTYQEILEGGAGFIYSSLQNLYMNFSKYITFTTVDEFKTYLAEQYNAGTPVYVDYVLAEPIDIECTEEQSTILFDIEQNAKTYDKVTHIYSTDEVSPNVEVTYKKDIETLFANTLVEGV